MKFDGKNVFISGGTSGIGLAAAKMFSSLGANIFVFSIDDDMQRKQALESIEKAGKSNEQKFESAFLDVLDNDGIQKIIQETIHSIGEPFVLINSAGIGGAILFEELSYERFDKIIKINLYGIRNVIAACLPHMKKNGGHIINVSSMSGLVGSYGYTAYSSSKHAVVGFSESLRAELKRYDINVAVLCPVQVDTPMLEATNKYKPKETLAINKNVGVMTAEDVAAGLYNGMKKKQSIIIPGFQGRFVHSLHRYFPRFREWMTDRIIRKSRKEKS